MEEANPNRTPASQDFVQEKLINICEWARQQREGANAADEATTAWYESVKLNGLCGGWVEIHKRDPVWIEDLWRALASWTPPPGAAPGDILEHLNEHMASKIAWCKSGRGVQELVLLLKTAYQLMDKLEPNAEYGPVPDSVQTTGQLGEAPQGGSSREITVSKEYAGREVVEQIQRMIGEKNTHGIVHIETDAHHMSVRIERTARSLVLMVVETEKTGIVSCSSWDDVMRVLQGGIYLDRNRNEDQQVSIKIFRLVD
ncbi:hypothetical protein WMF04_47175 [Sorangium sp. So ce260]|uniref:hypothetical protein n=1 Tax=Sorangium sp. So ce260 TaxID=3133291 RepID=UPI003F60031B